MDKEKAKKIIEKYKKDPFSLSFHTLNGAVQYLSAVNRGEILMKALKDISKHQGIVAKDLAKFSTTKKIADDAITQYEKEI